MDLQYYLKKILFKHFFLQMSIAVIRKIYKFDDRKDKKIKLD